MLKMKLLFNGEIFKVKRKRKCSLCGEIIRVRNVDDLQMEDRFFEECVDIWNDKTWYVWCPICMVKMEDLKQCSFFWNDGDVLLCESKDNKIGLCDVNNLKECNYRGGLV